MTTNEEQTEKIAFKIFEALRPCLKKRQKAMINYYLTERGIKSELGIINVIKAIIEEGG